MDLLPVLWVGPRRLGIWFEVGDFTPILTFPLKGEGIFGGTERMFSFLWRRGLVGTLLGGRGIERLACT